jgi:hypothetical protein
LTPRSVRRHAFRLAAPAAALALVGLAGARRAPDEWSLEGRYAVVHRMASVARVPVMGSDRSLTTTLLLVDVDRAGERLVHRQRVCDVGIESSMARMTIPDAFVRSLPVRTYTVPAGGRDYTADLGLETVGFDPEVTGGALPRSAREAGVVDSDGDGEPGATVVGHFPVFGRVRLFIAQRTHVVLHGRQSEPGRVEGALEVRLLEQRTLGASNGIFRRTVQVRPDAAKSGFTMVRTSARDCADLKREAPELFGS